MLNFLNGWKVYILGVGGILVAIGTYLNQGITLQQLVEAIWTALVAMGIRHGITTTVSNATGKIL